MRRVDRLEVDLVDPVEDVEQVPLGVDSTLSTADTTSLITFWRGRGARAIAQPTQVGEQLAR